MRKSLALLAVTLLAVVACNRGMKSEACTKFFAETEACAAKAPPIKAQALRATADTSKAGFEKNMNPIAVEKSCEMMLETVKNDPDCK